MHGTNDHRAGRLAALAVVVSALAWALCVTGAQADKGGVPHAGSNGRGAQGAPPPPAQDKGGKKDQEAEQAQPAQQPEHQARPKKAKHDKASHGHGHTPAKPKHEAPKHGSAPAASPPEQAPKHEAGSSNGQSKTTICHRTHSAKNPWVRITVANPALKAHRAHGDIIPAPAEGCPKPQEESQPPTTTQPPEETPPPDDGPPASPGELPGEFQTAASASPTAAPTQTAASPSRKKARAKAPTGAVLAESVSAPTSAGLGPVRIVRVSSRSNGADTAPAAVQAADRSSGTGLPFTGSPAWLLALMGAGAVLAGFALRRAILSRR